MEGNLKNQGYYERFLKLYVEHWMIMNGKPTNNDKPINNGKPLTAHSRVCGALAMEVTLSGRGSHIRL